MINGIFQFDFSVLNFIHTHLSSPVMDFIMLWVTRLTNGGFIWLVTVALLLLLPKYRKYGLLLLLSLILSILLGSFLLKPLFMRSRPCQLDPFFPLLVPRPGDFSFPSGHAMTSFASASVLWSFNRKIGITANIFALAVALSRMYLYVHFLTDVFAGAVLGVFCGYVSVHVTSALIAKRKQKK